MIGKENDSGFRVGQKIIYYEITDFHCGLLKRIMYFICNFFIVMPWLAVEYDYEL